MFLRKKKSTNTITYTFSSDQNLTFFSVKEQAGHQTPPSRRTATESPEIQGNRLKSFSKGTLSK